MFIPSTASPISSGSSLYQGIVRSNNASTGMCQVEVPELMGAGLLTTVYNDGLSVIDGLYNVPGVGSSVFIAINNANDKAFFVSERYNGSPTSSLAASVGVLNTSSINAAASIGILNSQSSAGFANVLAGATTLASNTYNDTLIMAASTGIAITGSNKTATFTNTGVTSLTASAGQLVASAASGAVTLSLSSSPSVSGTITAGTFSGSGSALSAVPASVLTGSTLASGVTTSSLTSLGTVASLVATSASITNASIVTSLSSASYKVGTSSARTGYLLVSAGSSSATTTVTTSTNAFSNTGASVSLTGLQTTDIITVTSTWDISMYTASAVAVGAMAVTGAAGLSAQAIYSSPSGRASISQSYSFSPSAGSVTLTQQVKSQNSATIVCNQFGADGTPAIGTQFTYCVYAKD